MTEQVAKVCPNTKVYTSEDVNGNWIGELELTTNLRCNDLVMFEYKEKKRFYVVYSEQPELNDGWLILEEVTEDEHERFAKEWRGVVTHEAECSDEMYL